MNAFVSFCLSVLVGLMPLLLVLGALRPKQDRHQHQTGKDSVHGGPGDGEKQRGRGEPIQAHWPTARHILDQETQREAREKDAGLIGIHKLPEQPGTAASDRRGTAEPRNPFRKRFEGQIDENRQEETERAVKKRDVADVPRGTR